jgi:hypothetical protein
VAARPLNIYNMINKITETSNKLKNAEMSLKGLVQ